ncbi:MAG TPA: helix-turn-helix transcriptional regulator [Urbifossiella sp.]|jgi:transcriptional regulator with XRE-family HTH domain|nr:helix-turn-helix transcriptional regulator [Urbifossiella sp.]
MADEDVKVLFGRRVRQLRKEKGVSQEAFAHQVRIDRSYFGSIERGERNVSLENICLIAAGLGVPPAELLVFEALSVPDSPPDGRPDPSPPAHRRTRRGEPDSRSEPAGYPADR